MISYLLRAFRFSATVMGGIDGNVTVRFRGIVSKSFGSGFCSVGADEGAGTAEEEVSVSRGGIYDSSDDEDELPPAKNPFSLPDAISKIRTCEILTITYL